jgi:hypothetical protein
MPSAQITQFGLGGLGANSQAATGSSPDRRLRVVKRQTKPTTQRDVTRMLDVVAAPEVCRLGPRTVACRHRGLNAAARLPPLRYGELVAQYQDLCGLPCLLTPRQPQLRGHPHDQKEGKPQAHDR